MELEQQNPDQMPFLDMVRARTRQWKEDYDEANRGRIGDGITMTMRKRGDYFGYLYARARHHRARWQPFTGTGMVTYPVIGRSIRSKTATAVATKVQTEVESVRDLPEKLAAADLARNILKYCREHNWTKNVEAAMAELSQLHRFCFIHSNYETTGGMMIEIPETVETEKKSGDTVYNCISCGFQFTPDDLEVPDIADEFKDKDLAGEDEAAVPPPIEVDAEYAEPEYRDEESSKILEHSAGLACPNCETNTLVLDSRAKYEKVDALTGNYLTKDTGRLQLRVESPLLVRIDSYKCLGFEYKRADWFNYHPLVPAYEIIALAPWLAEKLFIGRDKWSESARWHFDLNNDTSSAQGYSYQGKSYRLDELVEVDCWWIAPQACVGWSSPDDYELLQYEQDKSTGEWIETDKPLFTIQKGETVYDAFMRQFGSFKGALLVMQGEELVAIGNEHFTEKWNGVPWKIDAQSFYPQGEENLLKLQDAATNVVGLAYSHTTRSASAALVADPGGGFDEQAMLGIGQPGHIIYRKAMTADERDKDWSKSLGYLEPASLGPEVFTFIQLIIETAKEESGVFNETVGNVENSETLGGRQMALTQSLSLMTPTQQAKAIALIEAEYIWLELWQKYAPDEAYSLIKGTFEEEWKEQDIEAYKELDIRRELFITVVEGTDIPRTQLEMEQRFFMGVQLGLFDDLSPIPLQIRARIAKSVLGIDVDIKNYAAYKRLAARRADVIKQELEILTPNEAFTVMPDPQGFPMRVLRPEIVASLAQDVRTAPRPTDEHLIFIEYFVDQINALAGAKEPNETLIAAYEKQVDIHRAFVAADAVKVGAIQGLAANAGSSLGAPQEPQPGQPGGQSPQPPSGNAGAGAPPA